MFEILLGMLLFQELRKSKFYKSKSTLTCPYDAPCTCGLSPVQLQHVARTLTLWTQELFSCWFFHVLGFSFSFCSSCLAFLCKCYDIISWSSFALLFPFIKIILLCLCFSFGLTIFHLLPFFIVPCRRWRYAPGCSVNVNRNLNPKTQKPKPP